MTLKPDQKFMVIPETVDSERAERLVAKMDETGRLIESNTELVKTILHSLIAHNREKCRRANGDRDKYRCL